MNDTTKEKRNPIARLLGDIYPGEGARVFLMLLNIFLILVAYYIIKVVREPLILSTPGGAQLKSYGAAAQALALMVFVPFYSFVSSRLDRLKLITGLNLFFLLNIELFALAVKADIPYVGFAFFVWVGIFSLSIIAQFWSWANDLHTQDEGKRLFPIIAIGATLGSPIGSKVASILFGSGIPANLIMHISAALLLVSAGVYWLIQTKYVPQHEKGVVAPRLRHEGGFKLVFQSRYLLYLSGLLLLLNLVNTTGEYILSNKVVEAADNLLASNPGANKKAFIGAFYGDFYFGVNIAALILQAFVVSRIVKYLGIAGVVLMLPLISLGAYSLVSLGIGIAVLRWAKTAENATDYSVMNTARHMLWLPTSREEKYKAKQAVDTFIVRFGDVLSAGVVFAGINWIRLTTTGFALINIAATVVWIFVAFRVIKENRKLSLQAESAQAA